MPIIFYRRKRCVLTLARSVLCIKYQKNRGADAKHYTIFAQSAPQEFYDTTS